MRAAKSDILFALRIDPIDSEAKVLADSIAQAEESQQTVATTTRGNKVMEEKAHVQDTKIESESEKLKSAGNDALKAGDMQQALKLYTRALDIDPKNIAALGNRAFVNLKLSRFVDAEKDSTKVISLAETGEQTTEKRSILIKALYRRGLARRSMGGQEDLEKALADFNRLLKLDPDSKDASVEKSRTEILLKDKKKVTSTQQKVNVSAASSGAKVLSGGGSSGEVLLKEVQSVRKSRQVSEEVSSPPPPPAAVHSLSSNSTPNVDSSDKLPLPPTKPAKSAEKAKKSPLKSAPVLPDELPKTMYELERVWRGLKGHSELFATYLSTFKLSTFKKVFNDNISSDLMSSVFACTKDHICDKQPEVAGRILEGLTQMTKFDLTASLFPEEDLSAIRTILSKLRSTLPGEKIETLAQCYKVSVS